MEFLNGIFSLEMEFLDISLKKTQVFCSILLTVYLLADFLKKTRFNSGFKTADKKIQETQKSSLFVNSIL
jgi:hypothetical protein